MPTFSYNPQLGKLYAQTFALYANVPPEKRLFYYSEGEDCTNFISQCVWASYGGFVPGFTDSVTRTNARRILGDVRQVRGIWYGSASNIGSNRWCRVEEFYAFVTDRNKPFGPSAALVTQGDFHTVDPSVIEAGDVVQLVVADYVPNRFGHGLFVTRAGNAFDDILICCHTDDRLDEPLGWFAQFPDIYRRLRVLRFGAAQFAD